MEEITNEVVDVVNTETEVAETNDNENKIGFKIGLKEFLIGAAAGGLVVGSTVEVGRRTADVVIDTIGQGTYNLRRGLADKWEKSKADREAKKAEKKAEREARYQAKVAEKEAKQNNNK